MTCAAVLAFGSYTNFEASNVLIQAAVLNYTASYFGALVGYFFQFSQTHLFRNVSLSGTMNLGGGTQQYSGLVFGGTFYSSPCVATVTLANCTIDFKVENGGLSSMFGMYAMNGSSIALTNSTVKSNQAVIACSVVANSTISKPVLTNDNSAYACTP